MPPPCRRVVLWFAGPLSRPCPRFYRRHGDGAGPADERYKFIKMAWDLLGSEFAGRHTQYEKFYGGPPHIMDLYSFFNCPWSERPAAVDRIIQDMEAGALATEERPSAAG